MYFPEFDPYSYTYIIVRLRLLKCAHQVFGTVAGEATDNSFVQLIDLLDTCFLFLLFFWMHRRARSLERYDPKIEATARRQNADRLRWLRQQRDQMANNMNQYFGQLGAPMLTYTSIPCIVKPDFGAENFELKPHLI